MENNNKMLRIGMVIGASAFMIGFLLTYHPSDRSPATVKIHVEAKTVKLLSPDCQNNVCHGGYAYQDQNGLWWYYWFNMNQNIANSDTPYQSYGKFLPTGGTWSRSTAAPNPDEVENETTVSILENDQNQPTSNFETTLDAAVQDNPENAGAQPDSVMQETQASEPASVEAPSSENAVPASDSSSGSSDSGSSGGDGGGSD